MTEQTSSAVGTVAQEAARLIEDMATLARSGGSRGDDAGSYAGPPAPGPFSSEAPPGASASGSPHGSDAAPDELCSACGGERDKTPTSCRLCPLCQGFSLLRSVRPETVDLLADLALSVAATLREVAGRSRGANPTSSGRSSSGRSPDADRDHVQDIPVDDEGEE